MLVRSVYKWFRIFRNYIACLIGSNVKVLYAFLCFGPFPMFFYRIVFLLELTGSMKYAMNSKLSHIETHFWCLHQCLNTGGIDWQPFFGVGILDTCTCMIYPVHTCMIYPVCYVFDL